MVLDAFIESLRQDSLMLNNFKMAQIISVIMFVVGIIVFLYANKVQNLKINIMIRRMLMSLRSDCLVIGAGIAGMTAALYLKRSNVNVILIEKSAPGGQINMTSKIENYPGFDSIDGPTLAMNIFNQIKSLGVEYRYGNVIDIVDTGKSKIVKTDMDEIECQVVIIATGRIPKELGLENEKQLTGRGVSWCAVCDGFFYKDKKVAIIGGGNCALEEALFLADIAKKVYLIHRRINFEQNLFTR